MSPFLRRLARNHSVWLYGAITAQLTAAALVVYLQARLAEQQKNESVAILQQVCIRTAAEIAARARQYIDAAYFEIIDVPGIQMREYDLARYSKTYNGGIQRFTYIDSFFLWHEQLPSDLAAQVLLVPQESLNGKQSLDSTPSPRLGPAATRPLDTGGRLSGFVLLPEYSPQLRALVAELSTKEDGHGRLAYHAVDRRLAGRDYEVVMKLFFPTVLRDTYFAVSGYVVNLQRAPSAVFDHLTQEIPSLLPSRQMLPHLTLTVLDERGRVMYGAPVSADAPSASAPLDFRFFPYVSTTSYLLSSVPPRAWTVIVSAPRMADTGSLTRSWASGIAVLLIVFAICGALASVRAARRLARMQSDFVTNVSHQLKTPLSILAAASETLHLSRVRSPEKVSEYAELVRAQSVRLSKLIDQILRFSRAELGYAALTEVVDLTALVTRCVGDLGWNFGERDIDLTVQTVENPVLVNGDPDSLEHAIINLIDNATKYGKPGVPNSVTVRVETRGTNAVLSVRDGGVGIHPDEIPHIFENFYRGQQVRHQSRGFGLGLAIVHSVVLAHRGRVTVISDGGNGSEFQIFLPLA